MNTLGPLALILAGAVYLYMQENNPQGSTPAPQGKAAFVAELSGIVSSIVANLGLPSAIIPVIVAWAAMESNWGASKLAVNGNNLFGIKAGPTWQKSGRPFDEYDTHEHQGQPGYPVEGVLVKSFFRHYPSWVASVQDALNLLAITHDPPFRPAYDALARGDIQGFFQAIDASGYSTAARYSNRIVGALDTIGGLA